LTQNDMIALAEQKQQISLIDTIQRAGIELQQRGSRWVASCPFHADRTPSFYIFDDSRFHCFGCQAHGDVLDFVQKYYGVDFKQALVHLGIDTGAYSQPVDYEAVKAAQRKRDLLKAFRQWEIGIADDLGLLIRSARNALSECIREPKDIEKHGRLYHDLAFWEHCLFDVVVDGNDDDKLKLYKKLNCESIF